MRKSYLTGLRVRERKTGEYGMVTDVTRDADPVLTVLVRGAKRHLLASEATSMSGTELIDMPESLTGVYSSKRVTLRVRIRGRKLTAATVGGTEYPCGKIIEDIGLKGFLDRTERGNQDRILARRAKEEEERRLRGIEISRRHEEEMERDREECERLAREMIVLPATIESVLTVLKGVYAGAHGRPAIAGTGYFCARYECGRQHAAAMRLDEPIRGHRKIGYCVPARYLEEYADVNALLPEGGE